jgi:hypothetical protein
MKQYTFAEVDAAPEGSVFFGGASSIFVKYGHIVWWEAGRATGKRKAFVSDHTWRKGFFTEAEGFKISDAQITCDDGRISLDFILTGSNRSVVLNEEYTAEVSPGGVKVGCQTFPLSIVEELYKAVQEVSKK